MVKNDVCIFWHRRDLRIEDNHGLSKALESGLPVLPIFIFDKHILENLPGNDARVTFIHRQLSLLRIAYQQYGGDLLVLHGTPLQIWQELLNRFTVKAVFTNRDYEPYARERDKLVFNLLQTHHIPFKGFKDHVIFEKKEVVKSNGEPYTVFTPFSRKWKELLASTAVPIYPSADLSDKLMAHDYTEKGWNMPSLNDMGFSPSSLEIPDADVSTHTLSQYHDKRNFPGQRGTSRLGIHLRFGTISVRKLLSKSAPISNTFVNELIWRDFYQIILYHFPHTATDAFKPAYDRIAWLNDDEQFKAWCEGKTGYPIVDAGMRELNATGFMHNRVRMITASFLTKHLLIDWRFGERYFAEKLLDFELASNVGGWQWASGSGCDAAPYFRVFNPELQAQKFDKDQRYIKRWVPELSSDAYPKPIVEHKFARERAIATYKEGLSSV